MGNACLFCGQPATRLCDEMIAKPIGDHAKPFGRPAYPVTTMEVMPLGTCDAPICDAHAFVAGHICGKKPDTIDRCAGCHTNPRTGSLALVTVDKIPGMRRELHRGYRLAQITVHATPTNAGGEAE